MDNTILIVDDDANYRDLLRSLLEMNGYVVSSADGGKAALELLEKGRPGLVLSDIDMPEMDGYELCQEVRRRFPTEVLPLVLVTGRDPVQERVRGLEAGADDFLMKPVNKEELLARVRSLLRITQLHDTVRVQAGKLEEWGNELERRVEQQVTQLGQLKRFFSPQVAELVVSGTGQSLIRSHRKEVTVVFSDLRGFTAFAETSEPEEVNAVLQEYYSSVGEQALKCDATIGRLAGDGMMFFFNDPIEMPDHQRKAVEMSLAARAILGQLREKWENQGYELHFGLGVASGFATIGTFGFEKFCDYTVIGTVTNLAARLCSEAHGGQIVVADKLYHALEKTFDGEPAGQVTLKGLHRPVNIFNILRAKGD